MVYPTNRKSRTVYSLRTINVRATYNLAAWLTGTGHPDFAGLPYPMHPQIRNHTLICPYV